MINLMVPNIFGTDKIYFSYLCVNKIYYLFFYSMEMIIFEM